MKIGPMGAELFHADGRTDMTKLIVAPKNCITAVILYVLICKLHVPANRVARQNRAHIPLCNICNYLCGDPTVFRIL